MDSLQLNMLLFENYAKFNQYAYEILVHFNACYSCTSLFLIKKLAKNMMNQFIFICLFVSKNDYLE